MGPPTKGEEVLTTTTLLVERGSLKLQLQLP